ncbi:MAG: hypothetical protein KF800_06035 [Lysobacter sp.]|nr:hypothetical protein [Lysobacter sp.]
MDNNTQDTAGQSTPAVPPKRGRKLLKFLKYATISLVVVLLISHFAWKMSGSNEWKLAKDEGGVKLWTLKTPGSPLVKVKSTVRLKTTLSGFVKLLEGMSCDDAGCYEERIVERLQTPPGAYAAFVRFKFDVPGVHTQEYVLFQQRFQDPVTKEVRVDLIAAPDKIPRDECCVRITHLHNTWHLTPQPGGFVDVVFTQDTDTGGLPYPLANLGLIEGTAQIMKDMQALMDKPRYRVDSFNDIQELTGR